MVSFNRASKMPERDRWATKKKLGDYASQVHEEMARSYDQISASKGDGLVTQGQLERCSRKVKYDKTHSGVKQP